MGGGRGGLGVGGALQGEGEQCLGAREEASFPPQGGDRAGRGGEEVHGGGDSEAGRGGHAHRRVPAGEEGGVDVGGEGGPVGGLVEGRAGDGHDDDDGRDAGVLPELVGRPGLEAEEVGGEHDEGAGMGLVAPGVGGVEVPEAVGGGAPAGGGAAEEVLGDFVGGTQPRQEGVRGHGGKAAAVEVEQRCGRKRGGEVQGEACRGQRSRGGGTAGDL